MWLQVVKETVSREEIECDVRFSYMYSVIGNCEWHILTSSLVYSSTE